VRANYQQRRERIDLGAIGPRRAGRRSLLAERLRASHVMAAWSLRPSFALLCCHPIATATRAACA